MNFLESLHPLVSTERYISLKLVYFFPSLLSPEMSSISFPKALK